MKTCDICGKTGSDVFEIDVWEIAADKICVKCREEAG